MPAPPVPEPEPETTTPSVWQRPDPYGGPIDNPAPVDLPALIEEILAVDLTDSAPLTRLERLSQLGALDAALHAIRLATIASLSPAAEADQWAERHVVEELRLAMGVGDRYADALLDQARVVFGAQPTRTAPDPAAADPEPADAEPAETEPSATGIGRHWSTALVVDPAG